MFKIQQTNRVDWPVVVRIPRDGGKVTKARFTATFELLPTDEIDASIRGTGEDGEARQDIATRALVGWKDDLCDVEGNTMPYSEEAKMSLLKISYVRAAVTQAFFQASNGTAASEKN